MNVPPANSKPTSLAMLAHAFISFSSCAWGFISMTYRFNAPSTKVGWLVKFTKKASDKECAGSVEINNTFPFVFEANWIEKAELIVVFPTPPAKVISNSYQTKVPLPEKNINFNFWFSNTFSNPQKHCWDEIDKKIIIIQNMLVKFLEYCYLYVINNPNF